MKRAALTGVMLCVVSGWTLAQAPVGGVGEPYLFIDADKTRGRFTRAVNISRVEERLSAAATEGYGIEFMAGFSTSVNLLLKRGSAAGTVYRLVTTSREGAFLDGLNKIGAQGLAVVPGTIKALEQGGGTTWLAVFEPRAGVPRFRYSLAKGSEEGAEALTAADAAGRRLVGVLGRQGLVAANTLLFFEELEGSQPTAASGFDYRIIAAARTSAIERDINQAAAEGFRVRSSGFGHLTVVMARERDSTPEPADYRVIAMLRVPTAVKELQTAGADGFSIATMSENDREGVFVLRRTPGSPERFEYELPRLTEETANQVLSDAQAKGYRTRGLLNDLVVLERLITP